MSVADFDLLIVGGGINGAGIARDAAGRGLSVLLVDQDDLAAHTSSASTKLIHGGLRYLEQYEFRLVREALIERERLMAIAPHLVRPLRFVLPHDRGMRPKWMLRLGLFLYDHLGVRHRLPRSQAVKLRSSALGRGLAARFKDGFTYWDCWGDDSRLVVENAKDAADHGADVRTRTRFLSARRVGRRWQATLQDRATGREYIVTGRGLVNAAGSWADRLLSEQLGLAQRPALRLVRGSHFATRRLYDGDHAYVLQNADGRIVFVIPYEHDFTLIGTTDVAWEGAPDRVKPDAAEIEYLCESVNRCLTTNLSPNDVTWSYAGLRPLYGDEADNPSKVSRDYVLELDAPEGGAPVLSVFGGKITTYRALAEQALALLRPELGIEGDAWTGGTPLPGGDFERGDLSKLKASLVSAAPGLPDSLLDRWVLSYGAVALRLAAGADSLAALGEHFGAGLTQREVDYLVAEEWASTVEDILWRRSKLGLHIDLAGVQRLDAYLMSSRGSVGKAKAL